MATAISLPQHHDPTSLHWRPGTILQLFSRAVVVGHGRDERLGLKQGRFTPVTQQTQPSHNRWHQQDGGLHAAQAERLTQLEKENARFQLQASPQE